MGITLFEIGNITLGVAWMTGSATIAIFKSLPEGLTFMFAGFFLILILRVIEYAFIDHLDGRARGKW